MPFAALVLALSTAATARALPCGPDPTLSEVAASLLLSGGSPSPGALEEALRAHGSDLRAAHAYRVRLDAGGGSRAADARVARWLDDLRARADAPLVCGEATGPAQRLVVAAVRAGTLEVVGEARARIDLTAGFGDPRLIIEGADGQLVEVRPGGASLPATLELPEDVELPARVQLLATGPAGPRPIAERVVGAESASIDRAPAAQRAARARRDRPNRRLPAEASLLDAVASLRSADGGSPLRPNRLLAEEAQRHARAVCRAGRVVHELAPGADPERRLRARNVVARIVGEVVARSPNGAVSAVDALALSPSHRMTLIDRRFTDVGVGAGRDRAGRACVVVLLAAWPRIVPSN